MNQTQEGHLSQVYRSAKHVYAIRYEEHQILLDLHSGIFLGLNEMSAMMWRLLIECSMAPQEVVEAIVQQYDVDPGRVGSDVETFIAEMQSHRLLLQGNEQDTSCASSYGRRSVHSALLDRFLFLLSVLPPIKLKRWDIFAWLEAWITLRRVILWLERRDFRFLVREVATLSTYRCVGPADSEVYRLTSHIVSAARWQHFRTACLHQYLAICWMLRRRGVQAHVVIGVELFPFFAHAWLVGGPDAFQQALHWHLGLGQGQPLQRLRSLSLVFSTAMMPQEEQL